MKYIKFVVMSVLLIALVLGLYYYLSNIKEQSSGSGDQDKITRVQDIMMRNLDARYPPTPKEVVRFFSEVTQALHNENYTDRDFEVLGEQLYRLYDEELKEENPWELYLENLRFDIDDYRDKNIFVSSFLVSSSTDVIYFNENGFEYARLNCLFTLRQGTDLYGVDYRFLLRRGEGGRWYILGWQKEDSPL